MLGRLVKLAARSAQLREAALRKEAGLAAAAKWAGGKAKGTAITMGVGGLLASPMAVAKTKEFKAGFDPNSQQQMLGQPPTPPGA